MSLIHACVAYNGTILCETATGKRDFSQAFQTILSKIPPNNSKLTYVWEQYLFHYISEGGYTFLVMADDALGRRIPFAFLDELQSKFNAYSPPTSSSSTPTASSYSGFTPTLSSLMHEYNTNPPPDALSNAQHNLAQVKDIMVHNVEQILSRGERIELLVDKTDTMAGQAWAFRRGARTVRRQQFWKNQKIMLLSIAVAILLFYLFIANFCGLALNHCSGR
ncbi:related to vesicle-associated membrane protein 7 [Serendipita indica DSM 11827]|uniref:Synaptobrevin homolog YKT6 n=1 Tax=Serendipita indica (strain DSM 11827) TaxID=1109443 RepID=G4TAP1_SERID|nr:related to vesicle-associated membrane protein 7 [Serendipita indica DSM 11827]